MASACHSIAASMTDSLIHIWCHYESDLYYSTSTSKEQALLRRLRQWGGTRQKRQKTPTHAMQRVSSSSSFIVLSGKKMTE